MPPAKPIPKAKKKPASSGTSIFGAPPAYTPPSKKTGTPWAQFVNYWTAHGYKSLRQNSQAILEAAKAEHIDPVVFGALLLNESGANFNVKPSSTGAIGIGQLEPGTFIGPNAWNGGVLPWNTKHQITAADLQNPGISLRLSAAYYGYLQGQYPSDAYGRYNAGPNAPDALAGQIESAFQKKWISTWNPKYVSPAISTAPPGAAGAQVPGGTAPPTQDISPFKDPYVTGVLKGKAGKFATTNDPNNPSVLQFDGAPLTRSGFLSLKDSLTSQYISYTGMRPTNAQIMEYVKKGWSAYTLDSLLSKGKNFTKSPIFKQQAVPLQLAMKDLLPQGAKVPPELLRQATLNQWSASTLAAKVRTLPTYTNSNEFKGNVATLLNTHSSIMGTPDAQSMVTIKDAALAGWTSDQYAAYLRSQPAYQSSPEYQTKALTVLQALGLITGSQAVLQQNVGYGPGAVPGNNPQGPVPTDKRIAGDPNVPGNNPLTGLGATLSGPVGAPV